MSSNVGGDSTVSSSVPKQPLPKIPTTGGSAIKCPRYRLPVNGLPDRLTHACLSKKDLRYMDQVLKRVGSDPGPGHYKGKERADDVVHYTAPKWSYKKPKEGASRDEVPGTSKRKNDAIYNVCEAVDKVRPAPSVWTWPKGPGHRVAMNETCAPGMSTYSPVKTYVDAEWLGRVAACGAVQRLGSRCKKVASMADSKKQSESRKDPALKKPGPGPGYYKVSHSATELAQPNWSQSKTDCGKVRFADVSAKSKVWVPGPGHYQVKGLSIGQKSPVCSSSGLGKSKVSMF